MRVLRRILWLTGGAFVLLAILVGAAVWLLHSPGFAAWLAAEVQDRSDGAVRIAGLSGTLAEELRFANIEVDIAASRVVAEDVRLRIDLRSILARALVLDFVYLDRLTYTFNPGEVGTASGGRDVPILVRIRDARVTAAELLTPDGRWSAMDTRLGLRLLNDHLELTDVRSSVEGFVLEGGAALTWTDMLAIETSLCATGRYRDEAVAVCGEASGDYPDLAIDTVARAPFAATAVGTVHSADDFAMDIELQWTDAALRAQPNWRSPAGRVRLTGPLRELRAAGDGTAAIADEVFDFAIDAQYGADEIRVYDARVGIADMTATAAGTVASNLQHASLVVAGSAIDPEHWLAGWPGSLAIDTAVEVTLDGGFAATAEDLTVTGELRGRPIVASGALRYADGTLGLTGINLVSRSDSVSVAGTVGDALDLQVQAEVSELAFLVPGASGRMRADVTVGGTPAAPSATGELELSDVAYGAVALARLEVDGVAGMSASEPFALTARATGLRAAAVGMDTATVTTRGTLGAHEIAFAGAAAQWRIEGEAAGGWADDAWAGVLGSLIIDPRELESWALAAPGAVTIARDRVELPEACLAHAESQVCVAVDRAGAVEDFVQFTGTRFDIAILAPFFPSGFAAAGFVDFDLRVDDSPSGPRGVASVRGTDAEFSVELGDGAVLDFPLETVQLGMSIDQARMGLAASLGSEGIGRAVVNLDVADVRLDDSPLTGNISLAWNDTAPLGLLSPDVDNISGPIDAEVVLGGTLDAPTVAGEAHWTSGTIEVPVWGLVIDSIDGRAVASGGDTVTFTANGLVDGAAVNVEGSTLLDAAQSWPTRLRLRGEALQLVQLADAEVYVSPDLTAEVMLPNVRIEGSVLVPRARIEIVGLPPQAVTPSADTVVHGREQTVAAHPLNVAARLDVVLGDDVRYVGGNVDAKVTGSLALDYESARRASGVGALTLTGQYDAYGNPLDLERGQLIFAGPWDNPALDVRAVRHIEEITVGVQLVGTLKAPESTIFSDPAMSEADALSYLLFGRPLEDAGGGETATLQSAALSMGLRQALPVIERIGTSLGFDDFSIRGTNTDAGALMAGKYLRPNLYLRYSYGLFNRIGGLLLRYRINDRLSLETQSGEQKSMDLLYTVEKE